MSEIAKKEKNLTLQNFEENRPDKSGPDP